MEVTAQASYLGKGFQVQNDAGHHTFISDRMRQVGGTDLGPDSLQLLLASFATSLCSSAVAIANYPSAFNRGGGRFNLSRIQRKKGFFAF